MAAPSSSRVLVLLLFQLDLPALSLLYFADGCFLLYQSPHLLHLPRLTALLTADCCFAALTALDLTATALQHLSLGNGSLRFASQLLFRYCKLLS